MKRAKSAKKKFKRTKSAKKKFKRTKFAKKKVTIRKPLGGFLPLPPQNCEKRAHIKTHDGLYWVDLSLCHDCSIKPKCKRRKEYLQELKEKRTLKTETDKKEKTK